MIRIFRCLFSICLLIIMTFLVLKFLPGGPYDEEVSLHPLVKSKLEESWALHSDFKNQLWQYGRSVLHGNLGYSVSYPGRSVLSLVLQKMSASFYLNFFSICLIFILAAVLSSMSFFSRVGSVIIQGLIYFFLSIPTIFLGPLVLYIFGFYFEILPIAFLTSSYHYILPLVTLSLRPAMVLASFCINAQNILKKKDFITFSQAKGLSNSRIYFLHILKNILPMILSYFPNMIVGIFSGSFLVEALFSVPGLGNLFIESISSRDYPLIMGITIFSGIFLIILTSLLDGILFLSDPRLVGGKE